MYKLIHEAILRTLQLILALIGICLFPVVMMFILIVIMVDESEWSEFKTSFKRIFRDYIDTLRELILNRH